GLLCHSGGETGGGLTGSECRKEMRPNGIGKREFRWRQYGRRLTLPFGNRRLPLPDITCCLHCTFLSMSGFTTTFPDAVITPISLSCLFRYRQRGFDMVRKGFVNADSYRQELDGPASVFGAAPYARALCRLYWRQCVQWRFAADAPGRKDSARDRRSEKARPCDRARLGAPRFRCRHPLQRVARGS